MVFMDDTQLILSPEGLEIAQAYLRNGSDTEKTALALGLPSEEVHRYLQKREVRGYIDRLYNEAGFRNRDKMGEVWDAILATKLEEMNETGMGSNKDIVEIMEKMHKFKMDEMKMQMELLKAEKDGAPQIQVNTQNNYGENYNSLLDRIINGDK